MNYNNKASAVCCLVTIYTLDYYHQKLKQNTYKVAYNKQI